MSEEVLIVGAGPTGLILALTLDKFDIPFKIIEKKKSPDEISKAMLVVPGTLEHYSQLDLVKNVLENGLEPEKVVIHNHKETIELDFEAYRMQLSRYSRLFTYPQDEHERFLIQTLEERGHKIHWNISFETLDQQSNKITVQMKEDEETFSETFTYVIGADGGSSAVRKAVDIPFEGGTNEQVFFVADAELENEELQGEVAHVFMLRQNFLLAFPLSNQKTKRLIGIIPEELVEKDKKSMEHMAPIFREHFGIEIAESQWFSEYKIHHRLAESFKVGNVFLAGDAAHVHSPVGGQGMNAGIADAINLGWKLAYVLKGKSPKQLLYTYHQERSEFAKELVSTTDRAFKVVTANNPFISQLRSQLITTFADLVFNKTDRLSDFFFKTISQMATQYEETALNAKDVQNKLLGSRLPYYKNNLNYTDEMKWHVQVYGQIDTDFEAFLLKNGLFYYEITWEDSMKDTGFSPNTAYLIRPDGYIAWVSEEQDVASIARYLHKWRFYSIES